MNRHVSILILSILTAATLVIAALIAPSQAIANGARQLDGVAFWPGEGECSDPEGDGSDYAVKMTGDLEGCHYTFVETSVCSPSGTYRESGTEIFVGKETGKDSGGTFRTTYKFEAKYQDCENFVEVFGRCQHPIIAGSGTGAFEGVTGRLDFKDDVEAVNFPYRGHLRP